MSDESFCSAAKVEQLIGSFIAIANVSGANIAELAQAAKAVSVSAQKCVANSMVELAERRAEETGAPSSLDDAADDDKYRQRSNQAEETRRDADSLADELSAETSAASDRSDTENQ